MSFYQMQRINDVLSIDIFGNIKPSNFAEDFEKMGNVGDIVLHVNSEGGDFAEARTIYTLLKNNPARKHGYVVTFAGSSAILPLMACDRVSLPSNAVLLFHDPHSSSQNATAAALRSLIDSLDEASRFLVSVYSQKSNLSEVRITALMNNCTWIEGSEALTLGLCNEITGAVSLVPVFDSNKFRRIIL